MRAVWCSTEACCSQTSFQTPRLRILCPCGLQETKFSQSLPTCSENNLRLGPLPEAPFLGPCLDDVTRQQATHVHSASKSNWTLLWPEWRRQEGHKCVSAAQTHACLRRQILKSECLWPLQTTDPCFFWGNMGRISSVSVEFVVILFLFLNDGVTHIT